MKYPTHVLKDREGNVLANVSLSRRGVAIERDGVEEHSASPSMADAFARGEIETGLHYVYGEGAGPMIAAGVRIEELPAPKGPAAAASGIVLRERFFLAAHDDTEYWNIDLRGGGAFDVSLVRDGEATHLASFEADQWHEFIENRFSALTASEDPESDPDLAELDGLRHENGGERGTYRSYVDHEKRDTRFVTPVEEFEFSADEYRRNKAIGFETDDPAAILDDPNFDVDRYRKDIWDTAREAYATGSVSDEIEITNGMDAWRAFQVEQEAKATPTP